jgi:tRNA dimethylallyltransferase
MEPLKPSIEDQAALQNRLIAVAGGYSKRNDRTVSRQHQTKTGQTPSMNAITTEKPKIIVVCGPTGIGKTATAIALSRVFRGEIIGADSMQIYRHMDIGTAKPTPMEQAAVTHHMIDIVSPDDSFDAARYSKMARRQIHKLHEQGITPVVTGGTGLYIRALIQGIFESCPVDSTIRDRLKNEAACRGDDYLFHRLLQCDAETAKRIHPNDKFRIRRALEVYESTGKPISQHHTRHGFDDQPFAVMKIGLAMERHLLYERINQRVETMINHGLLGEVKELLQMGYPAELKPMQSIGYRHMVEFIRGEFQWEETLHRLKRDTRRYAKRQLTWFRRDDDVSWIEPDQLETIFPIVNRFLNGSA